MPLLYPTQGTLHEVFSPQLPFGRSQAAPEAAVISAQKSPSKRFRAWSAADDVRTKANALSQEAQKEIAMASSKAQAKAGKIKALLLPRNKKLVFEPADRRCSVTRLMGNDEHVFWMGRSIGGCLYVHDSPLSSALIHLPELYYLLCISPRLGDCSALVLA